jgi:hypothetical protein
MGKAIKYVYWQDEDMWLGYLEEYPDYWTQGRSLSLFLVTERLRTIWQDTS